MLWKKQTRLSAVLNAFLGRDIKHLSLGGKLRLPLKSRKLLVPVALSWNLVLEDQ